MDIGIRNFNRKYINGNANFEENNSDGISKSVSQGEYGALPEGNGRLAEASEAIKRGSEDAIRDAQADKGTVSRREEREIVNREAEKYVKENGIWLPTPYHEGHYPLDRGRNTEYGKYRIQTSRYFFCTS